ncbi:PAAR domain-containing protein [Variovorax sp. ZS18.2.2]|uniref:PAAR domain-containing protein n=1 Tax=Variovorax sp. ZS18.2.2 TaxID=2971255 RepID=UPI00215080ED|nr:PAAR domain-containing protein [Variovorax sp. ZS18.2.2]MCR6480031.1 PAAR domain-containing protein [Variovorax sp. ZS18.2.2]
MRDADNRPVVRLGDPTDHGGEVITALDFVVHGIPVTAEDCMTWCPKCKGNFRIITPRIGRKHLDKTIAYEGDLTECGARLISTLRA